MTAMDYGKFGVRTKPSKLFLNLLFLFDYSTKVFEFDYVLRPAKSSDKAEDLPLLGRFFFNFPPLRFIFKFLRFF